MIDVHAQSSSGRQVAAARHTWDAPRDQLSSLRRDVGDWPPPRSRTEGLATALGWFSIGLGLAEILAPRTVARGIGLGNHHQWLIPLMGAREVATGIGILTSQRPAGWLWARVAGDVADLACLSAGLSEDDADERRIGTAAAAVAGVTLLDIVCASAQSRCCRD